MAAKTIIVNAGKEETHARRFYEKNGFEQEKEAEVEIPLGSKISPATYKLDIKKKWRVKKSYI
jgi:hypothetical protein